MRTDIFQLEIDWWFAVILLSHLCEVPGKTLLNGADTEQK